MLVACDAVKTATPHAMATLHTAQLYTDQQLNLYSK